MPGDLVSHIRTCTHPLTQRLHPGRRAAKIALEAADHVPFLASPCLSKPSGPTGHMGFSSQEEQHRHGQPHHADSDCLSTAQGAIAREAILSYPSSSSAAALSSAGVSHDRLLPGSSRMELHKKRRDKDQGHKLPITKHWGTLSYLIPTGASQIYEKLLAESPQKPSPQASAWSPFSLHPSKSSRSQRHLRHQHISTSTFCFTRPPALPKTTCSWNSSSHQKSLQRMLSPTSKN